MGGYTGAMLDPPTEVVFGGVIYKRNPNSDQRAHRVYYNAPRGSGRGLLHRDIWSSVHGPIPEGHLVHHDDHDPFNNDPSNLLCVDRQGHANEHPEVIGHPPEHMERIRPLATAWHQSEEGRAWHREHGRRTWEGREPERLGDPCGWCGGPIDTMWPGRPGERFCSRRCNRAKSDSEQYEVRATCPICGTEFWQDKYRAKPETCGRPCGATLRRQRSASGRA